MDVLRYNGQNVYTHSTNECTKSDLSSARIGRGVILGAYFFQIGPDRIVEKMEFDKNKVEGQRSGLMVDVKSQFGGQASVAIAGLDRIVSFLCDTASLGKDLSVLKDSKVTEYASGMQLLGIGVDTNQKRTAPQKVAVH